MTNFFVIDSAKRTQTGDGLNQDLSNIIEQAVNFDEVWANHVDAKASNDRVSWAYYWTNPRRQSCGTLWKD